MKKIALLTFLLLICGKSFSQDIYRTVNGYVLISGEYNDSAFLAESHKLEINYDSRSKIIFGKINLKSIISGIPGLDSLLFNYGTLITMTGYIPVDFLTWEHKEYNLEVQLEIKLNDKVAKVPSQITFTHTDKVTSYTCVMEAAFKLDLDNLKANMPDKLNSKVKVQFLQLILRRGDQ